MSISSNLHISDPVEDAAKDKKKGIEDRVRPLLDMMRDRYHPKQHISVNEKMVATKTRGATNQYMKAKPTKWGQKLLADVNGYTIDFKLYTGKSKFSSGKGLSLNVVTSMVDKDYLALGYIVYCDNFYTSPVLFQHLRKQGSGACGTYRQDRVGVPSTQENALHKRSRRGSIRWIRDGNLLFIEESLYKRMNSREVSLCTTLCTVGTQCCADRKINIAILRGSLSPYRQL